MSNPKRPRWAKVLRIRENATEEQIKDAYWRRIREVNDACASALTVQALRDARRTVHPEG